MSDTPGLVFLKDMETKKKQPGFFRLYGKLLLLFFFVAAGVLALFLIAGGALSYRSANMEYERLARTHVRIAEGAYEAEPGVESAGTPGNPYPARPEGAVLEIDFEALGAVNADTVAWLHIPSLQISYPVVYAADREYYISHTFEGASNGNGTIFMESFNHPDFSDRNTFLYGHNSADGSMFGNLHTLSYEDAARDRDPFFYVYLKNGEIRKYRPYSFYVTTENSESFRTIDDASYDEYVRLTKREAQKKTDAEFADRPDLLTLSTCYGETGTVERYLVHARRVP